VAGEDAPARAQGRATDAGLRNGGSGSNNGRSGSSSGSSNELNGRAGSCNGRRPAQGPRAGPRIAARGADNDPPCDGGAAGEIYGPPIGPDADLHLRRYTQLTQRQQIRGDWSAQDKSDQLHRLKIFYADPQTPRGDLDPHRYLSNRVAKMFDHQWYEGTIITYCHEKRNYGIYWEDGDSEVGDLSVTLRRIEDWYVKTGQLAVGARIQSGAPFALMHFHHDSLERKAAMRGAFPFLASKHALGLSFQLRDHPLTTCELSPEIHCCLHTEPVTRRSAEQLTPLIRANGKTYGNRPSRQEKEAKTAPPKTRA
jgi:hypothetical protein